MGSTRGSLAGSISHLSLARPPAATCPYCCGALEPLEGDDPPSGFRFLGSTEHEAHEDQDAREICRRCRVSFDVTPTAFDMSDEDRQRVLVAGYRARRARDRFKHGRGDRYDAVSELAEAFACLREQPGVRPFCPRELHAWASTSACDAQTRDCAAFILHVADAGARWSFGFDAVAAMRRWDASRRAVFLEWARRPWWA